MSKEEAPLPGHRSRGSSLVCNLEHSFLLSPEERELDNALNTPPLSLKSPQHITQNPSPPSALQHPTETLFNPPTDTQRGGNTVPSTAPPLPMNEKLEGIFKADFVPSLLKRSSSSTSTATTATKSPSRAEKNENINVDKKLIERLLSRIDDLEDKIENLNPSHGVDSTQNHHNERSETISNLSLSSQSFTTQGTQNVSMKYRVLSPPSSITGGLSSDEDESRHRRHSSSNSDMIESLNSKIETNHEHLTRLDHVVTMQEETIRRQQETLQNMLKNPTLLTMAPLRITRFMRRVVTVNRYKKMKALKAKNHAADAIGSVARGWLQRLRFNKIKTSTFKIQACARSWKQQKAFQKKKLGAKNIQKIMRGASVRRPVRLRHLYLQHITNLRDLKDSAERLEKSEVICPITKEIVNDSVVCLVDGKTYEKEAITTWIQMNKTSPLTRDTVTLADLVKPSEMIEELKTTKQSYRENLKSVVELKKARDDLQHNILTATMKLSFVSNEVEELKTQHESESAEIEKLKAENVRLRQDIASIYAKNEFVEADNGELRKQLNRSARRAKSVQHERDAFNLQLATVTVKAENLEKEVEEGKSVHQRFLSEFSQKWATQNNKETVDAATMLKVAIAGRNSRSLLEESCWGEGSSETQVQGDDSDGVVCCSGRSGLEEGTWEGGRSDGNKSEEEVDTGAVSCGGNTGTRGALEDSTWISQHGPLTAHQTSLSELIISKELLKSRSNKVLSFDKLKQMVAANACEENHIDRKTIEYNLSDKTFNKIFGIEKGEWANIPNWKRINEKKKVGLFV